MELLPCPFCGSEVILYKRMFGTTNIECAQCNLSVRLNSEYSGSQEPIRKAWNTRTPPYDKKEK